MTIKTGLAHHPLDKITRITPNTSELATTLDGAFATCRTSCSDGGAWDGGSSAARIRDKHERKQLCLFGQRLAAGSQGHASSGDDDQEQDAGDPHRV
jgi:hypothetical protein